MAHKQPLARKHPKATAWGAGIMGAAGLVGAVLGPSPPVLVATERGAPVGVVGLESYATKGLLRSLAVDPQHRCRGPGARLVDAIESEAQARGVPEGQWSHV